MPAMTLAPGGIGGAVVSDNITVTHLLNVKRLAYPLADPPAGAYEHAPDVRGAPRQEGGRLRAGAASGTSTAGPTAGAGDDRVDRIVRRVLQELGGGR